MAEIHGKVGALYYAPAYIAADTISFADTNPDTILDSGNGFVNTLVTNWDMELDANWNDSPSAPAANARSGTQEYAGTYSRKFTPNGVNQGIKSDVLIETTVTGVMYAADLWVYPDDGTRCRVVVYRGDNGTTKVYDTAQTGLTQDAWNNITFEYTETAGGALATIQIDSDTETSGDFYVDNVLVTVKAPAGESGGFTTGMKISVSGSTSNNDEFTIAAGGAAPGVLTLVGGDSLTAEAAGDDVIIKTAPRGTQLLGFRDWSIDDGVDVYESTDFTDGNSGYKTRVAALTDWSATCNGFYQDDTPYNFAGLTYMFRFFIQNAADPTGTTAYYYEGLGIVESTGLVTPVDGLVTQVLNIVGTGSLTLTSRTTAWK